MASKNKMTRILITGISGFVGSHICEYILKNTNWEIVGLDNLNYAGSLNRFTDIDEQEKERITFIYHDLQAPITELTHNMIGQVKYVVHLAAESVVSRSLIEPLLFIKSNILGTANIIEYVRQFQENIESIISFSSDEVLGPTPIDEEFSEDQYLNPSSPYSVSKACSELMSRAWVAFYGLPIIIVRSSNIYGKKQYPEDFISKTVKTILENRKIELHGSIENPSSRSWVNVEDVNRVLMFLLENGKYGEIYHIEGEKKDIYWLANKIYKIVKNGEELKENDVKWIEKPYLGHDFTYRLKDTKLKKMGWEPILKIEKSLEEIIKFMINKPIWLNIPKKVKT